MNNLHPLTFSLRHFNHESNHVYHYYTTHLNDVDANEIARTKMDILRKRVFELRFNFLFKVFKLEMKMFDEFYTFIESDDFEKLYREYR